MKNGVLYSLSQNYSKIYSKYLYVPSMVRRKLVQFDYLPEYHSKLSSVHFIRTGNLMLGDVYRDLYPASSKCRIIYKVS